MPWEFSIDVGGTFTDCLATAPSGDVHRFKLLSSGVVRGSARYEGQGRFVDPQREGEAAGLWSGYAFRIGEQPAEATLTVSEGATLVADSSFDLAVGSDVSYELSSNEEAPVVAIRYLLGIGKDESIPDVDVRLGTTRGTNALLTRQGATVGFVTTKGFGDAPLIGNQSRPHLFELGIRKQPPLFSHVLEVDERIGFDGDVLSPLDEASLRRDFQQLLASGIRSLAVCLINAYRFPLHELSVGRIALELGFEEVSLSHQVSPLVKLIDRADTTLVNAYLNPVLQAYVARIASALSDGSQLRMLTSAGGLVAADRFAGKDSILSGPAGGVVGYTKAAQAAGFDRAIGFDMGGTSTDVSRFASKYAFQNEAYKAGVRIVTPMMAIETVAAGGGSICSFDGVKLTVGPQSAGAEPGPACYGRGGPLTVTDINVVLGRIPADRFPFPLDVSAANARLIEIAQQIAAEGDAIEPLTLAAGYLDVANANMAQAIRAVSVAQGYDPRDYALVGFGGAAGQHVCAIADQLGMNQILSHPDAGILSAFGIGLADVVRHRARGVYQPLDSVQKEMLEAIFADLAKEARGEVLAEGVAHAQIEERRSVELRFSGLEFSLELPFNDGDVAEAFHREHTRRFGYTNRSKQIELVSARMLVAGRSQSQLETTQAAAPRQPKMESVAPAFYERDIPIEVPIYAREALIAGDRIVGPAIVAEARATTVIDRDWTAVVLTGGELVLRREAIDQPAPTQEPPTAVGGPDPIRLELYNNQFASIAGEMGITLQNTSSSVNVKERLDFSCAIFTADGDLVVNAPHIPVHLGAMSETVKQLIADNPSMSAGDVFVTNDPFRGGSHLPDITVVTPVYGDAGSGEERLFFTASRAHHAEIGGISPGSMPPFSKTLAEEGVLIRNFRLLVAGQSRMHELSDLLQKAPYPSRAVDDNLADIGAQMAANLQGATALKELIGRDGRVVIAYMKFIQEAAARKTRMAISRLPDGSHDFEDHLDNGARICVSIEIRGDEMVIDFSGTSPALESNLNANRAIVTAAVMYTLRCLIDEDIPLNQGVLAPVSIVLPTCMLNPRGEDDPKRCPPVAGGNVETSQRVVDVLLAALRLAAASQGTMNNLLFGDDTFGYYETICGGEGATTECDGADGVHTHMTNTRITDPEIMEMRYPVRIIEFSIRDGSGGEGRHRGGNGIVRRLQFLKPLHVSLLSSRRNCRPFGLEEGAPGAQGVNTLIPANGIAQNLEGAAQFDVQPGDQLQIETPGGGGYGRP